MMEEAFRGLRTNMLFMLGASQKVVLFTSTQPGEGKSFIAGNEKVNILEALAMAGDMTVYGVRDNVKLIREDAKGKREIINLNLNNAELVVSPYYYLRQNDIIYVTPNKTKAKNSDIGSSTSIWISATSILVSLASLLATILK
jgi:polysaccharide biosynthesis/export protein